LLIQGTMELVMFDPRPESPTYGQVYRSILSDKDPCIINVPKNIWHADHNIGDTDVIVVNFPTIQYDHSSPDKWRLPINTPLIPHAFPAECIGG
jgi:dTDP-4-dehydrorhamnose 3,5-epimerase